MIHNGFHKSLTQVSIQRKISPVQLEACLADPFNIILSSIPRTFKRFVPSSFLTTNHNMPPTHPLHTPKHTVLLDMITRIIFGKQYRSRMSSLCHLLQSTETSSLLDHKYIPQHPILNNCS
jgi:hypothetical protein